MNLSAEMFYGLFNFKWLTNLIQQFYKYYIIPSYILENPGVRFKSSQTGSRDRIPKHWINRISYTVNAISLTFRSDFLIAKL